MKKQEESGKGMTTAEKCLWGHLECILNNQQILYLAEKTAPKDWKRILQNQDVDDYILHQVESDFESFGFVEMAYQGFQKWKQRFPAKVCVCNVTEALYQIGRNDIKNAFMDEFDIKDTFDVYDIGIFGSAVKLFVGREQEIARVVDFCVVSKNKLLIVSGLPGIGKSELIQHSMSAVLKEKHSLNFSRQSFLKVYVDASLSVANIAAMIYEEMHPGTFLKTHRVCSLSKLLTKTSKPTILVLEMSYSCFSKEDSEEFWKLIQEVLIPENALKIIITCCTMPNWNKSSHVGMEILQLQDLDKRSVISLLQYINPGLSEEHCSSVADYCYGNPFLVCKMGALIKNFHNHNEDICALLADLAHSTLNQKQVLITQSVLKHDLEIAFEKLNDLEKTSLTKLLCFYENISIDEVESVFGLHTKGLVKQLHTEHGLLERSNSGMYYMSEPVQMFLKDLCQANDKFSKLLLDSKKQIIKFYSRFLWFLDEVFFVPSKLDEASQVKQRLMQYRSNCKKCETEKCNCPIPSILQIIFQEVKASLFCYIQGGLHINCIVNDVIDSCCKASHFLRKSLPHNKFQELFELLLNKARLKNDKLRLKTISSNMVLTETYHRPQNERQENIAILTDSIDYLEELSMLNSLFTETLAISYANRGYLKGFYGCQFKDGILDIEKGRKILSRLTFDGRVEVTYLRTRGYLAAIYYQNDLFCESRYERQLQLKGYGKLLGVHPSTAKSLHYLGLTHLKMGLFSDAQTCFVVSYQMYQRLYGAGVETMTVFSDYGTVLLEHRKIDLGIKYIEKALRDVENISEESERVALCYKKLAAAKQVLFKNSEGDAKFQNKADEIREQYLYKFNVRESPKFHLPQKENGSLFGGKDNLMGYKFKKLRLLISVFFNMIMFFFLLVHICTRYQWQRFFY